MYALPLIIPTLFSLLSLPTPTLGLSEWYTPPGGPPTGSGFNATGNTSAGKIKGVNLGGYFILENWMTPKLFGIAGLPGKGEEESVMDEYTFCKTLGKEKCREVLEDHWDTFYEEDDFKRMADYGLNTLRIPVPYWIWNTTDDEPFITGAQLPYLQRTLNWSYIYGLDVILDMHALPGSQSSYQVHTGLYAQEGFENSTLNMARALDAITQMTREFTKPEYAGVVRGIELVNEPWLDAYMPDNMSWETLVRYMSQAYTAVREAEEVMQGNEPVMVIVHDAFGSLTDWSTHFFGPGGEGHDWVNYAVDTHIYRAWSGGSGDDDHITATCGMADYLTEAQTHFPVIVGEFSLGTQTFCVDYKDCFNLTLADALANITSTNGERDMFLRKFWEAQMHVYEHTAGWIFWNWKTELAPTWSYDQSVAQGWIPVDLSDQVFQYDPTQSYCLQNQNWSNTPAFATDPDQPAPLLDGTASPVHSPMTLQLLATDGSLAATSTLASSIGSVTLTGSSTVATAGPASATVTNATGGAMDERTASFGCVVAVLLGVIALLV